MKFLPFLIPRKELVHSSQSLSFSLSNKLLLLYDLKVNPSGQLHIQIAHT